MPFGASLELETCSLELDCATEELDATSPELDCTSEELLGASAELTGASSELDAGAISELEVGAISELETGASPQAFGKLDAKHLSSELELSAVDSMLDEEISPVDDNGEVAESSPQLIKAMALAKITPLKIFDFILGTPFTKTLIPSFNKIPQKKPRDQNHRARFVDKKSKAKKGDSR
jgi:hypothetical protein